MSKTCFVIMPISDSEPYEIGHFKRVYEYIIKPAVIKAGFEPIRADDVLNTNYIAIDIIRKIINAEMAVCDLSSRNPNVLYELGIRQAFNLPVTFLKDTITNRVFDIQGFRDIEYDENLRIDNVEISIELLSETITNTYNSKQSEEVNSLISLLGIQAAKISTKHEITTDTELILSTLETLGSRMIELEKAIQSNKTIINNVIPNDNNSSIPRLTPNEINELKVGDMIYHGKFGVGKISKIEGTKVNPIATVHFISGEKKLMLNYAILMKPPV
jgi:hypothetical protein